MLSPRSGRQPIKDLEVAAAARCARFGSFSLLILGFRFASPQALCFHPLTRVGLTSWRLTSIYYLGWLVSSLAA